MLQNEEELVKMCQNGENDAFGSIYDEYIGKIYKFIYYKTHHKETAEDLTSKTFFKALEKIQSYNHSKSSFSVWLYKIARNTVIDHYRTHKSEGNIDDMWNISDNKNTISNTEDKMLLDDVAQYVQKLEEAQKEILIMRVWEDLSYKEIAEIIGKSEANCRMIYMRAINKLRTEVPLTVYLIMLLKNLTN